MISGLNLPLVYVIRWLQVIAALSFSSALQQLLHEAEWGDTLNLSVLYKHPDLIQGPGVRIAIEVSTVHKACLNPASGRMFLPGPYLSTLHALVQIATPGQILLTDYALTEVSHECEVFHVDKHTQAHPMYDANYDAFSLLS